MPREYNLVSLENNSDVLQSSFLTDARFNVKRMEMQIILILIAAAQRDLKEAMNSSIRDGKEIGQPPVYKNDIQVAFSLKDFPLDMSGNEMHLKRAAENLVKQAIETKTETGWVMEPLLSKVEYVKKERLVVMNVSPSIWSKIMDIRLGYSEYELFTALSLKSTYSVRFYMMASSNLGPREIPFDELKQQFNLEKKYNKNTDFIKYVIEPAVKELDEKASVSFTATPFKKPGTKEYVGIVFSPKKNLPKRDPALEEKKLTHGRVQIGMALAEEDLNWLENGHLEFSRTELNRNFDTFNVAKKRYGDGLVDAMQGIYEFMLRKGKGGQKGYFIKALKTNCERQHPDEGVLF